MTKYSKDHTAQISTAIAIAMPMMMMTFDAPRTVAVAATQRNRVNATSIEAVPNSAALHRRQKPQRHHLHIGLRRRMLHRRHSVSPPRVYGRPSLPVRRQPMYISPRPKQQLASHLNSHLHRPSCIRQTPELKIINSHANRTATTQ